MRIVWIAAAVLLVPGLAGAQDDVFSLDGLVVTVSPTPVAREAVSSHVSVLEGEDLRARGLLSVGEALREVAGADIVRNGSFGAVTSLFMRGGESDHTLVLVDGVQVNRAGGGFDFSALTLDNVERIEVVRGPASALYGSDAMAGVVHVVTRTGRGAPTVRARIEATSFREPREVLIDGTRWSADLQGGSDRFGYSAAVSREVNEGILDFNNRFTRSAFTGRARFLPDTRSRMDLTVGLTDRTYHRPTDGSGQVVDRNAFDFGDESLATLALSRFVSDRVELEGFLRYSEVDGGTDDGPDDDADPDAYFSLDHFQRTGAEVRANVSLGSTVLTLGGELEEERQRSFSESSSSFGTVWGRSENDRVNRAAFAHVTGQRSVVAVNGGARLEDNERFGTDVTWQAGLSVHLPGRPDSRLRASFGTALKEPTFYENFASGFATGNPDLDPERSRSWEVGAEHAVADLVRFRVTYFDQSLRDLIQYTFTPPQPGGPNFYNVAGATSRGVEAGADGRWRFLDAGASYTWLDTEVTNSGFDDGPAAELVDGERLLRRPKHTIAVRAAASVGGRGRVHAALRRVGSRADRSFDPVTFAAAREELPGYSVWSVGGEWLALPRGDGSPSVSVSLRGENLLDESYEEAWGFAAPGRRILLGLTLGFGGS